MFGNSMRNFGIFLCDYLYIEFNILMCVVYLSNRILVLFRDGNICFSTRVIFHCITFEAFATITDSIPSRAFVASIRKRRFYTRNESVSSLVLSRFLNLENLLWLMQEYHEVCVYKRLREPFSDCIQREMCLSHSWLCRNGYSLANSIVSSFATIITRLYTHSGLVWWWKTMYTPTRVLFHLNVKTTSLVYSRLSSSELSVAWDLQAYQTGKQYQRVCIVSLCLFYVYDLRVRPRSLYLPSLSLSLSFFRIIRMCFSWM